MKFRLKYFFSLDIYQLRLIVTTMIIKVIFETIDDIPYLSVYLFSTKVYRKRYKLKRKNTSFINLLQSVNTTNGKTEISYGFNNPSTTGLLYGVLSVLPKVNQYPNFLPQYDYIIVDGSTYIYWWTTIMKYLKYRRKIEV